MVQLVCGAMSITTRPTDSNITCAAAHPVCMVYESQSALPILTVLAPNAMALNSTAAYRLSGGPGHRMLLPPSVLLLSRAELPHPLNSPQNCGLRQALMMFIPGPRPHQPQKVMQPFTTKRLHSPAALITTGCFRHNDRARPSVLADC